MKYFETEQTLRKVAEILTKSPEEQMEALNGYLKGTNINNFLHADHRLAAEDDPVIALLIKKMLERGTLKHHGLDGRIASNEEMVLQRAIEKVTEFHGLMSVN